MPGPGTSTKRPKSSGAILPEKFRQRKKTSLSSRVRPLYSRSSSQPGLQQARARTGWKCQAFSLAPAWPLEKCTEERTGKNFIPAGRASDFNQALMELGALICIPSQPRCPSCPVKNFCSYQRGGDKGKKSGKRFGPLPWLNKKADFFCTAKKEKASWQASGSFPL